MAAIGTSYEDYKASHSLTRDLEPNEQGYRPTYHATLGIYEAIGTDNDFFDPKELSTLSEEALVAMSEDLGAIAEHINLTTYYSIHGNSGVSTDGIDDLYLVKNDVEGAKALLDAVPNEHGSLVIGILKRDFVEGGMAPADVQATIGEAITTFKNTYESALNSAWEAKAEINRCVEAIVKDGPEAVVESQNFLRGLSSEQKEFFRDQFDAWSEHEGMTDDVRAPIEGLLGDVIGERAAVDVVPAAEHEIVLSPAPGVVP